MRREFLRLHCIYLSLRNVSYILFSRHDDIQSSRPGGSVVQWPLNAVMASRTRTTVRDWTSNSALTGPCARPGILSCTCTGDAWPGAARARFSAPTPKPTWRLAVATAFEAMSGRSCIRPAGASSLVDASGGRPGIAAAADVKECVICMANPRAARFGCGHAFCCADCADELVMLVKRARGGDVCPTCRCAIAAGTLASSRPLPELVRTAACDL